MPSPEEFWRRLHELAEAFDSLGRTTDERSVAAIRHFYSISPAARRQLISELFRLASELPELYPIAMAVERDRTTENRRGKIGADDAA